MAYCFITLNLRYIRFKVIKGNGNQEIYDGFAFA